MADSMMAVLSSLSLPVFSFSSEAKRTFCVLRWSPARLLVGDDWGVVKGTSVTLSSRFSTCFRVRALCRVSRGRILGTLQPSRPTEQNLWLRYKHWNVHHFDTSETTGVDYTRMSHVLWHWYTKNVSCDNSAPNICHVTLVHQTCVVWYYWTKYVLCDISAPNMWHNAPNMC